MTKKEFAAGMEALRKYKLDFTPNYEEKNTVNLWYPFFKKFDAEKLMEVIFEYIADNPKFPTVAHLRVPLKEKSKIEPKMYQLSLPPQKPRTLSLKEKAEAKVATEIIQERMKKKPKRIIKKMPNVIEFSGKPIGGGYAKKLYEE